MLGIVVPVPLDIEADGCGLPSRKNSDRSHHCCHLSLATLPALGRIDMLQMPRVEHMGAAESRAAGVLQRIRHWQAAVRNDGGFLISFGKNERKAQKTSWLGHEETRVDLHPSFVGGMQESFQSIPFDPTVFENVPSIILQPKSAWSVEGKAYVMGLRRACRSTKTLGLFLLDNMVLVLGASKGRGSTPNLDHTCREICVISLATFTMLSADGSRLKLIWLTSHLVQSVTAQEYIRMWINMRRLQRG